MTVQTQASGQIGYWSYVSSMVIILFLIYIIEQGLFKKWTEIIFYSPSAIPAAKAIGGSDSSVSPGGGVQGVANQAIGAVTGGKTQTPGLGSVVQGALGGAGQSGGGIIGTVKGWLGF
jgi:hypothetical protein